MNRANLPRRAVFCGPSPGRPSGIDLTAFIDGRLRTLSKGAYGCHYARLTDGRLDAACFARDGRQLDADHLAEIAEHLQTITEAPVEIRVEPRP